MNPLEFSALKSDIQGEIDKLLKIEGAPKDPAGFSLIEGFFYTPLQSTLNKNINIGGPTLINIAIIGNSTKVIYYYPVKALLPERLKDF